MKKQKTTSELFAEMPTVEHAIADGAKPVDGFEGYFIYPDGRLLSFNLFHKSTAGVLKGSYSSRYKYRKFTLWRNGKATPILAHKLVADYFLPKPPTPKHQINHIDGDKNNNHFSNLEWVTPSENQKARIKQGSFHLRGGFAKPTLSPKQVIAIKKILKKGLLTHQEIANMAGVQREAISKISKGKRWTWLEEAYLTQM